MKASNRIHIGTSGWSYKHWKGIFYPTEVKPASYLSYYSGHFSVSEINTSFYRLPLKSTVEKWVSLVPEKFLFCPKMSRYLSHLKKLHDPEEPLQRFFKIFEPISKHLGPVLIQLPATVKFDMDLVSRFFDVLREDYRSYRFAMEVRHKSWFSEESLNLMKKSKITLVFAQSDRYPYHEEITAKDIFIRFHGPDSLYSSPYSDEVLEQYAAKMTQWAEKGHTIWAFFNNDVGGHAINNAKKLLTLIQEIS
jgi:uncharacterized protein YecE (DUF72 family)